MKRLFAIVAVVAIMILSLSAAMHKAHKVNCAVSSATGDKANTEITPEMMNGGAAFFKTYEDFINGTGRSWIFLNDDVIRSKGHITEYDLVFKDEAGKKVKLPSTDFWGWRDANGYIFRNGDFIFEGIKKIPFLIKYVAGDFIFYQPMGISWYSVDPRDWCSEGVNSPIISREEFFKTHDQEGYKRIRRAQVACDKDLAVKKRYTVMKDYEQYLLRKAECYLKSQDLLCIWTEDSRTQTSFGGSFHGSYIFNKSLSEPSR